MNDPNSLRKIRRRFRDVQGNRFMLTNYGNPESRWGLDAEYLIRAWREMLSMRTLPRDMMAGAVIALVSLPLNLSFAAAANVEPEVGIIAGIVGGFLAALFGGSNYSITGPAAVMGVFLIQLQKSYGTDDSLTRPTLVDFFASEAAAGIGERFINDLSV